MINNTKEYQNATLIESMSSAQNISRLQKLGLRSEILVNRIILQLSRRGKTYDGQLWVKIPASYFFKASKSGKSATFNHLKKLKEEGLIITKQFDKSKGDMTNYYTIDVGVITSSKFKGFFTPPIVHKVVTSYKGFISPYRADNKSPTSQNKSGMIEKERRRVATKSYGSVATSENIEPAPNINRDTALEAIAVASPLPKSTTVQDMHRIWQEETGREDKLNKRLARFMVACYQKVFKTLDRWREYVKSLCRSTYITENMFSKEYFLKWVLSFKVIQRILDGGFGVGGEASSRGQTSTRGTNHLERGEERMTKANRIAQDILSDSVLQLYKRYESDREARGLIAKFVECYGKYEAITVFDKVGINFRGKILKLYANGQFWLDRFMEYGRYNKFIEHCEKTYDFKCCELEA